MKHHNNYRVFLTGSEKRFRRTSTGNVDLILVPNRFYFFYIFRFGKYKSRSGNSYRYFNKFWRVGVDDFLLKDYVVSDKNWTLVSDSLEDKNKKIVRQLESASMFETWKIIWKNTSTVIILRYIVFRVLKKIRIVS